jgi:RHS repeat-associated protein
MKKISLLGLLALLPLGLHAQTGVVPFGSYSSTPFDTINNQNLNTYFTIPIVSSAGRGLPLTLSLNYNSQIWQPFSTWTPVTDAVGNPTWGWQKDFPAGGIVQFESDTSAPIKCEPGGQFYPVTFYSGFSFMDVLGNGHGFPIDFRQSQCPAQNGGTKTGFASDASGIYMDATNPNVITVKTKNGFLPVNGNGPATDINGNFVTKTIISSTETDWKDSVGNTLLKIFYTGSSSNPSQIQYEFLDGTGASSYQTITLKFTALNIKTAFACTGVTEYTSTGTINMPSELDIPSPVSGTIVYSFSYEPTPGASGYYTGRLKKVALPTGGSYEYDYGTTNDGVNCTDGTTLSVSRVVTNGSDSGTWNFVRNTTNLTTTVTTPQLADTSSANDTKYTFNSASQEISRIIYSNSPGTTVLRTITTSWAANSTPSTRVTLLEDGTTKSETDTTYDLYGNLQSQTEYDWGTGAHGSTNPIRTTSYSYLSTSPYTSRNILNLVTEKQITDSGGVIQYRQDTAYDGSALTCPTGIAQHDDTDYPCSLLYRGNPTSVTTYKVPAGPSGGVTKNFTYDWFGNLLTADVNCCQKNTWVYSANTKYSQPDSVTSGNSPTQLTTSATYNLYTEQIATSTNPNNQVTHYYYDFLRRPTSIVRPNSTTIGFVYDDLGHTSTTTVPFDSTRSRKQIAGVDSLGYPNLVTIEDGSSNVFSIVGTSNDVLGRAYKTTDPYTSSAAYYITSHFDAIGRPTSTTMQDSSTTTYTYSTNTATITDPASKKRKAVTDAAGRVSSVYEPDTSNNLTVQTSYTYTVLDSPATAAEGSQTRTYTYDNLGRLTDRAEPEIKNTGGQGHYQYQYNDYDLLTQLTDPRGVIVTYGYDTLNRLHTITYNVGTSGVAATAGLTYTYGGTPASNNNGRLITMADGPGSENYSYDILGRMTQLQKVISGTTYTTNYQYNLGNEVTQITYPSGRVVQRAVDAIGRLCAIAQTATSCTSTTNPFSSAYQYNTASQLTNFNYGNGVAMTLGYSGDRLQLNSLKYVKSATTLFSLNYSYGSAGSNNGQISGITDNVDNGRTVTYTYDNLARLSTATTVGSTGYAKWGVSMAYDRYGNRTDENQTFGTPPTNHVNVDATTNRLTTGYGYDLNGNMTNDGSNTIAYDAENRAITSTGGLGSGTYTYDGNNLRVKKVAGSTTTVYVFSGSLVIAEYVNGVAPSSPTREYVYSGSTLVAKVESGATQYYHPDQLSARLMTDSTGAKIGEQGHYPFGESWYLTNTTTKWQFTSYERDSESGNDYARARVYVNRLARFASPDSISGSPSNPQSLNLFAYTLNDPLNGIDPTGQCPNWHGKVFAPFDLVHGDDTVKKVICTSASALNHRPDGGWSGTAFCDSGDLTCLAAGGKGMGAFYSDIANMACNSAGCSVGTAIQTLNPAFFTVSAKDTKPLDSQSLTKVAYTFDVMGSAIDQFGNKVLFAFTGTFSYRPSIKTDSSGNAWNIPGPVPRSSNGFLEPIPGWTPTSPIQMTPTYGRDLGSLITM